MEVLTMSTIEAAGTYILPTGTYWPIHQLTTHPTEYVQNHRGSPINWIKELIEIEESTQIKNSQQTREHL